MMAESLTTNMSKAELSVERASHTGSRIRRALKNSLKIPVNMWLGSMLLEYNFRSALEDGNYFCLNKFPEYTM